MPILKWPRPYLCSENQIYKSAFRFLTIDLKEVPAENMLLNFSCSPYSRLCSGLFQISLLASFLELHLVFTGQRLPVLCWRSGWWCQSGYSTVAAHRVDWWLSLLSSYVVLMLFSLSGPVFYADQIGGTSGDDVTSVFLSLNFSKPQQALPQFHHRQ